MVDLPEPDGPEQRQRLPGRTRNEMSSSTGFSLAVAEDGRGRRRSPPRPVRARSRSTGSAGPVLHRPLQDLRDAPDRHGGLPGLGQDPPHHPHRPDEEVDRREEEVELPHLQRPVASQYPPVPRTSAFCAMQSRSEEDQNQAIST